MNFWDFASQHPFWAWGIAWGLWPICWALSAIITAPFSYTFKAYNRKKRFETIQAKGWPTARFMDADGDIVHPPKEDKE